MEETFDIEKRIREMLYGYTIAEMINGDLKVEFEDKEMIVTFEDLNTLLVPGITPEQACTEFVKAVIQRFSQNF